MDKFEKRLKFRADPNNTFWANDESTFGKRMLRQMGWQAGKGLGANETGTTTNIEAVRKSNNAGTIRLVVSKRTTFC